MQFPLAKLTSVTYKWCFQFRTLKAIRILDLVTTSSGTLLGRVEPVDKTQGRVRREIYKAFPIAFGRFQEPVGLRDPSPTQSQL